ncbi:MarR family transcriptional regulator, partial [Bacillus cereus]
MCKYDKKGTRLLNEKRETLILDLSAS